MEKVIAEIENKDDVKLFIKLVSGGTFYEEFGKVLIDKNLIEGDVNEDSVRSKVKEITFSAMYSANTSIGQNPAIKTFEELFPNVYSVFKMIKKGHRNGRYLAISLQKIESELILERICRRINKAFPKIPLFTIHDSIATTEEYVEIVENFMSKILKQYTGIAPKLKIERWG